MAWLNQNGSYFANAGFAVLLLSVSLVMLLPTNISKRKNNAKGFLIIGLIGFILGLIIQLTRLASMSIIIQTGSALIIAALFEYVNLSIENHKNSLLSIKVAIGIAAVIGFILVIVSVIGSNLH